MTYRIAHVRFAKSDRTYPVNCHRKDLSKGDLVVVAMPDQANMLKVAEIDRVEYLNWDCRNTIVCRQSEFREGDVIREVAKGDALETLADVANALQQLGWTPFRPTSRVWYRIFARSFPRMSAVIAFRRNGVDYQVFDGDTVPGMSGNAITLSQANGRLVRHSYYASEVDLFEQSVAFAKEMQLGQPQLNAYFEARGRSQPNTNGLHK